MITQARGGWWHDYVCPTHGTELEAPVGATFPCPAGCRLTGERLAAAWTVLEHQAWARRARLLARRGAPADTAEATAVVREFAELYQALATGWSESSESWMLRGKLFSQALTEAIWAVQLADAVVVLADDPAARAALGPAVPDMLDGLLATVEAARHVLVGEQGNPQSNYTAWLDAAGSLLCHARVALGTEPDAVLATRGSAAPEPAPDLGGVPAAVTRPQPEAPDPATWVARTWEHAALAVGPDGWEWEGSTYYHLFVLRAYLLAHRGVRPDTLPAEAVDTLASMVRVLAGLAAPDGSLPALHDGPYDRRGVHLEVLEICVLARQLWSATGLDTVEAFARAALAPDHDGLEDLLDGWFDGPALPALRISRESRTFASVGYAVLRDGDDTWQAVLDAGPHGGSHGHLDKLGLYLYGTAPWQPAPGVPPYGSALRHGYYARTLAHPTVRAEGLDQAESTGQITSWTAGPGSAHVVARADDAIPGVLLSREVRMADGVLVDVVTAQAETEQTLTLALRPAVALAVTAHGGGWTSTWSADGARGSSVRADGVPSHEPGVRLHGSHAATVESALVLAPGRGPSDDPSRLLAVGDWTARATRVSWVSVYHQGERPIIHHVEPVTSGTVLTAVRVHLLDGTTTEHEVSA